MAKPDERSVAQGCGVVMFGLRRKPRWSLEFVRGCIDEHYRLESDSIGKLLGYISIPIEEGRRPSVEWNVAFLNKNGGSFQLLPDWPDSKNPEGAIIQSALQIDSELVRATSEPALYEKIGGKMRKRPLGSQINGKRVDELSLQDRIDLATLGHLETESVFGMIRRVFAQQVD